MLEFAGGQTLGMDIGQFLELESAFEGDRIARAPADIDDVLRLGNLAGEVAQARRQRLVPCGAGTGNLNRCWYRKLNLNRSWYRKFDILYQHRLRFNFLYQHLLKFNFLYQHLLKFNFLY